jgi:hypothetical protein
LINILLDVMVNVCSKTVNKCSAFKTISGD